MSNALSNQIKNLRVPFSFKGFQFNGCKNPACRNFMVPPICEGHGNCVKDGYALSGKGRERAIRCKYCNTYTIVKSNKAIIEEFERQANYLRDNQTFCSNHECDNYHYSVELHPKRYHSKGKGTSGNKRFTCKLCRKYITQRTKRCFQHRLYSAQDKTTFKNKIHKINEPYRSAKALTRVDLHLNINELADLYNAASVERLDSYFQSIRRNLPLLGRPFATQGHEGRLWHGMALYNPKIIQKVLDIYRVYINYVKLTRNRKGGFNNDTPAMRLGLARGLVKMEDILYQS